MPILTKQKNSFWLSWENLSFYIYFSFPCGFIYIYIFLISIVRVGFFHSFSSYGSEVKLDTSVGLGGSIWYIGSYIAKAEDVFSLGYGGILEVRHRSAATTKERKRKREMSQCTQESFIRANSPYRSVVCSLVRVAYSALIAGPYHDSIWPPTASQCAFACFLG